jgi:predicted nuclease of predicted toxin-antitoxin system
MTFFIDNNLGANLVVGLRAFGEDVIHLTEKFPQNTPDEIWLKEIGERNYFLITRDERIRWNPAELGAFCKYKVGAFLLGGKNLKKWEIIQQLIRNWPRINEMAGKTRKPFAFRIPPHGTKFSSFQLM